MDFTDRMLEGRSYPHRVVSRTNAYNIQNDMMKWCETIIGPFTNGWVRIMAARPLSLYRYYFEREEDAVLFKLTWGNSEVP